MNIFKQKVSKYIGRLVSNSLDRFPRIYIVEDICRDVCDTGCGDCFGNDHKLLLRNVKTGRIANDGKLICVNGEDWYWCDKDGTELYYDDD